MHLISNILLDKVTKTVNEQLTFCKLKIVFNELCTQELILLNPFVPDALFFYPLKTFSRRTKRVHWEQIC